MKKLRLKNKNNKEAALRGGFFYWLEQASGGG